MCYLLCGRSSVCPSINALSKLCKSYALVVGRFVTTRPLRPSRSLLVVHKHITHPHEINFLQDSEGPEPSEWGPGRSNSLLEVYGSPSFVTTHHHLRSWDIRRPLLRSHSLASRLACLARRYSVARTVRLSISYLSASNCASLPAHARLVTSAPNEPPPRAMLIGR